MTAANPNPGEGTTPGAASTVDPGADPASTVTPGTATPVSGTSGAPTSGDYDARIRAGGDFASQEVKAHQSGRDQAEATNRKTAEWMGDLEQYQGQLSGSDITRHLGDYNRALTDPKVGKMVRAFLDGGQVPTSDDSSDETTTEFETDDEKKIREQGQQISELSSRVSNQEAGAGTQALQQHIETFFKNYPSTPEVVERVKKGLTEQVRLWAGQKEAGVRAMQNLMSPKGVDTVNLMAFGMLTEQEQEAAVETRRLRREQGLGALSTGVPSTVPGSGNEPPPIFENGEDAIKWARAHPEAHDSY